MPPSTRIICRISATLRWLKVNTGWPRFTSSVVMSACRSEKARIRSGASPSILSNRACRNDETLGFCRASGGRTV